MRTLVYSLKGSLVEFGSIASLHCGIMALCMLVAFVGVPLSAQQAAVPEAPASGTLANDNNDLESGSWDPFLSMSPSSLGYWTDFNPDLRVRTSRNNSGMALSKNGRSRLHLGLDIGAGFFFNPYSVPSAVVDATQLSGDVGFRIRPRFLLDMPGEKVSFDLYGSLEYGLLPGFLDNPTEEYFLTRTNAGGGIIINPKGKVNVIIRDDATFTNTPGYFDVGTTYTYLRNNLRGGVGFRPGGGALTIRLDANFNIQEYFDSFNVKVSTADQGAVIDPNLLDSYGFGGRLRADWRFLPKTGLFAEVTSGYQFYPNNSDVQQHSIPSLFAVGMQGRFTKKLSGLARIGYSNPFTFYNGNLDSGDYIGLTGQLEARYEPSTKTDLALGVHRTFHPTPLFQHITNNRAYGMWKQFLGRRLVFRLSAGYSYLQFGRSLFNDIDSDADIRFGQGTRNDHHIDVTADIAFYLTDWMAIGLSNDFDYRMSNKLVTDTSGAGLVDLNFMRDTAMLFIGFYY